MPILYSILGAVFLSSFSYYLWLRSVKSAAGQRRDHISRASRWPDEVLLDQRQHTDPLADRLVHEIMSKGELSEVNHLFSLMSNDHSELPPDAPGELREYFRETALLPSWADPDLMRLGQQVYIRHGIWISLLLSYKSLPECYACAKGVEVLYHTGRLNEHHGSLNAFYRRIAETAQFVMDTMSPGGLSPTGKGLQAAQKVRLIHAIIRYYLQKHHWDEARFDKPINQEDMAGTLMAFSALVLEGLGILGIKLEKIEKDAYQHCWCVIGHIMGLQEGLIPHDSDQALDLGHAILNQQMGASESGKVLMMALIDFQTSLTRGVFSQKENIALMRLMMGSTISDMLGVPLAEPGQQERLTRRLRRMARVMEWLERSVVFALPWRLTNQAMLHLMIWFMNKSRRVNFFLPPSLTKDWSDRQQKIIKESKL